MIQIKRNNKVFFTIEDFGEGSKLSYQLMDHHFEVHHGNASLFRDWGLRGNTRLWLLRTDISILP